MKAKSDTVGKGRHVPTTGSIDKFSPGTCGLIRVSSSEGDTGVGQICLQCRVMTALLHSQ